MGMAPRRRSNIGLACTDKPNGERTAGRLFQSDDMDISSVNQVAAQTGAPAETALAHPVTQEQRALIQAVKAVGASGVLGQDNELTFIVDRATRRAVVRIVNRNTGELVDQIPPESVLKMAEELNRS
jgi:uncharacterized FlaG/YvyC family protein